MSKCQVLNKYSAGHPVDGLDAADRRAVNEILAEFDATVLIHDSEDGDYPYWLIQEVPE